MMSIRALTQPEFILLTQFDWHPEKSALKLGSILGRAKKDKRPDPKRLFTSLSNILPIPKEPEPTFSKNLNFYVVLNETSSAGGAVVAEESILSAIGGKLGWQKQRNDSILIDCRGSSNASSTAPVAAGEMGPSGVKKKALSVVKEQPLTPEPIGIVEITTFEPSTEYIKRAVESNAAVKIYTTEKRTPHIHGRPVFMVTGLMCVRGNARIEIITGSAQELGAKASADFPTATAAIVPLRVKAEGRGAKDQDGFRSKVVEGPFILAYRLRKIRMSRRGDFVSEEDDNTFALLDGDRAEENVLYEHEEFTLASLKEDSLTESDIDDDAI